MLSYSLENVTQDRDFLAGKEVGCRAVFPSVDGHAGVRKGEYLLVLLSNGQKYKGRVIEYQSVKISDYYMGELIIQRA